MMHSRIALVVILCLGGLAACSPAAGSQGGLTPSPATPLPSAVGLSVATTAAPATAAQPASLTPPPVGAATATPAPPPVGGSLPDPSGFTWTRVAQGFNLPVAVANAGDGTRRLFVVEKAGTIRIFINGAILPTPFLDIRDRVNASSSELGLLGVAFHPNFTANGYFYVNYTDTNGNTAIARFTAPVGKAPGEQVVDPSTELILLHVNQIYPNHKAGELAFGPDGYLWFGLGDGGSQGDPHNNGQSLNTFLGKMLRIDVDYGSPYAIPPDNPYVNGGGKPEIWAYGFRNPWRFTFDSQTGDLFIADVGQDKWEEIDWLKSGTEGGTNFGWSLMEGTHPYKAQAGASTAKLTDPIFEYGHDQGCAVIGGPVYRGKELPAFNGVYLFGDYCSGNVWGLAPGGSQWVGKILFQTGLAITSFGTDEAGEVYLVDSGGEMYRLEVKG